MKKVGLIGLGSIGHPLSVNLIEKGYEVYGYRRSEMDDFVQVGGIATSSPKEVAENCDTIITVVPSPEALNEVVSGENGLLAAGSKDLTLLELGSFQPSVKENVRVKIEQAGHDMLDAPILGVPFMVAKREGVIFVSGEKAAYEQCKDIFDAMSDKAFYLGEFGVGMKMKFVANSLVGIHILAAAEAMTLGLKAGLDKDVLLKIIPNSAASSTQFEVRAPMMVNKEYEPARAACALLQKDLAGIVDFLDELDCNNPLTRVANEYFQRTKEQGLTEKDCAAVVEVVAKENSLKL